MLSLNTEGLNKVCSSSCKGYINSCVLQCALKVSNAWAVELLQGK